MNLPGMVAKKFAEVVTNKNEKPTITKAYTGKAVVNGNGTFVKLDGSNILTPVILNADVKSGDKVTVSIENHTATIVGNVTNPASGYSAKTLYDEETKTGTLAKTISSVVEEYAQNSDSTVPPTTGWSTDHPSWKEGQYIWSRSFITYLDTTTSHSNPVCITGNKGTTGTGVSSVDVWYADSESSTTAPTTGWQTTAPAWKNGHYIWSKTITTYTDKTTDSSDPVCITGNKGEDAVSIYIHSSNGTAFKNDEISTVMTVTVYHGGNVITDQAGLINSFGLGSYLQWSVRKYGDATFTTILSTDSHLTDDGWTYTLGSSDIDTQAVFALELVVPD